MRRITLATLVLIPALAHAQAGASSEAKPSAAPPAEIAALAGAPALGNTAALAASMNAATGQAMVQQTVREQFSGDFLEAALRQGGTLEYSMMGSVPLQSSAPKITRAVEMQLSERELSEQPAVSNVVVHAIVDENGIPRNLSVTHSAGAVIDRKAIEAVSQYRFTPAMLDNQPTWAAVSVTIKIQKQQ